MRAAVVVGLIGVAVLVSAVREISAAKSERVLSTSTARRAPVHDTERGIGYLVFGLVLAGAAVALALRGAREEGPSAAQVVASLDAPEPPAATAQTRAVPGPVAADAPHTCPGCGGRLQAARASTSPITLHLCGTCGGTWADGDALAHLATSGGPERIEGHTDRRCALCRLTLSCALWGATPVETCTACGGVYLDHGELEELAPTLDLPLRPSPAPTTAPATEGGFTCPGCQKTFPYAHGNATAKGLVCRSCAPIPGTTVREREEANLGAQSKWYDPGFSGRGHPFILFFDLSVDTWRTLRSGRDADRHERDKTG